MSKAAYSYEKFINRIIKQHKIDIDDEEIIDITELKHLVSGVKIASLFTELCKSKFYGTAFDLLDDYICYQCAGFNKKIRTDDTVEGHIYRLLTIRPDFGDRLAFFLHAHRNAFVDLFKKEGELYNFKTDLLEKEYPEYTRKFLQCIQRHPDLTPDSIGRIQELLSRNE